MFWDRLIGQNFKSSGDPQLCDIFKDFFYRLATSYLVILF